MLTSLLRKCSSVFQNAQSTLLLQSTGDSAKLIWSTELRLQEGCPDFSHVTGDGQLQCRPEMGLVHLNRSMCSLFLHSCCVYSHLWWSKLFKILYTTCIKYFEQEWSPYAQLAHHSPGPRIVSTAWPITLACALALPETVSGRVFSRISRIGYLLVLWDAALHFSLRTTSLFIYFCLSKCIMRLLRPKR